MHVPATTRRYDIDALRIFAFILLILYHVGMFYVAPASDWGFHIKSQYAAEWLQYPMLVLNRWRMPLVFLVSGLAVHFMRRGATKLGEFAGQRTLRLLVPLAFGMAVVVPIQPYCEWLAKGAIEPGFGHYLLRYWTEGATMARGPHGWTWNHLWYLIYLWLYTLVLAALMPLLESGIGRAFRARVASLRGPALLSLPVLPFAIEAFLLQDCFPETHALVGDWFAHAMYFTAFAYGYLIGTHPGLWDEFMRLRWKALVSTTVCLACYLSARSFIENDGPDWLVAGVRLARWAYMWLAIVSILGWTHRGLNRPFRWLPYANSAVYPWYVFHQSLIVAIGFALTPLALGPVLEPTLVLIGTIGGCALLHHFIVRRAGHCGALVGYATGARRRDVQQAVAAPR
jgi:glucans biosynthesis protein C